ncbi:unnamed protein product, partial [Chrysoparadoxa australica]
PDLYYQHLYHDSSLVGVLLRAGRALMAGGGVVNASVGPHLVQHLCHQWHRPRWPIAAAWLYNAPAAEANGASVVIAVAQETCLRIRTLHHDGKASENT